MTARSTLVTYWLKMGCTDWTMLDYEQSVSLQGEGSVPGAKPTKVSPHKRHSVHFLKGYRTCCPIWKREYGNKSLGITQNFLWGAQDKDKERSRQIHVRSTTNLKMD